MSYGVEADKFSLSRKLNQIQGKIFPGYALLQISNRNKSAIEYMRESGLNSHQGKKFLCSPRHLGSHWAPLFFVFGGYLGPLAGVKRMGSKADYSSQSS